MISENEREIFKADRIIKITEEDQPVPESSVNINGVPTKIGPGFQRILRMYKVDFDGTATKVLQVSFFSKTLEDNKEYRTNKLRFLKAMLQPFQNLITQVNKLYNVAVQA